LIPNICTSILNRFAPPISSEAVKKLIDEKNVFFDPNRNTNILEIWTTSDPEPIVKETKEIITRMKKNIEKETYEAKHAGNTVMVIGPGGKVRDVLLNDECRAFFISSHSLSTQVDFEFFFNGLPIESLQYYPQTEHKPSRAKVIGPSRDWMLQFCSSLNQKFEIEPVDPKTRNRKLCTAYMKLTWHEGTLKGEALVRWRDEEDAKSCFFTLNGSIWGEKRIICNWNPKKK
jgi:hypothetical protein